MKKLKIILVIVVILFNYSILNAFIILDNGFNARSMGMGGAFAALDDDTSALYYNPALLYQFETPQISAGYSRFFHLYNKFNIAYIQPKILLKPDLGLSFISSFLLDNDIPTYSKVELGDIGDYNEGNKIDYYEYFFMIGGGIKIKNIWMMNISGGISSEFLYRDIDNMKSYGIGINIGVAAKHRFFNIALTLKNLFLRNNYESGYENLPLTLRIGTYYKFKRILYAIFKTKEKKPAVTNNYLITQYINWKVNPLFDMDLKFDNTFKINYFMGIEGWLNNLIAVRIGYNNYQKISWGASVDLEFLRFDYSYTIHSELLSTHKITVTYFFR